ncbi:hypothetical protein V3C99_014799 [Haemonchus contortus]|uniref:Uncharacterized protein n=1 Tax=Haemonchus contortus TaxID=6289 RepID=A0A7I4YUA5_HAECO
MGSDHPSALDSVLHCVERAAKFSNRGPKIVVNWNHFASLTSSWEDSVCENIDGEYNRLVEHLHGSAREADSLKDAEKRLPLKAFELTRQRGISSASGNNQLTSKLAQLDDA